MITRPSDKDHLTLIFHLLLKEDIIGSRSLEGMSEIFGNDDIHHIHKLDIDTILVKSAVEIVHQSSSQLTLNVTNLADLNATYVVSNSLFTLLSKELLKFVGSQVVQELLAIILSSFISSNVESHTNINRDFHVVLSGTAFNL